MFVYKVYSEKRPSSMTDSDSPFYLGIYHTKNPTEKPWFKASAMGVNKLRAVLCKYRLSSFGREKMKSLKLSQKNGLYK